MNFIQSEDPRNSFNLEIDGGSDCRFLETAGDSNTAYVYISLYPIPLGVGVCLGFEKCKNWKWFHRTGKY